MSRTGDGDEPAKNLEGLGIHRAKGIIERESSRSRVFIFLNSWKLRCLTLHCAVDMSLPGKWMPIYR